MTETQIGELVPDAAAGGAARSAAALFAGSGEMRALCRAFDWSATALGPVERWSHSLRTVASIVLASRNPMFLWWGPELVQLYNDAYRPSLGEGGRHPRALGSRGRDFWTDIWDTIGPQIAQVMGGGEATWHEDQYLPIERNGRLDDVWWTYSYSAVRDDDGSVGGTLVVCQETTRRVLGERERERLLASTARAERRTARLLEQVRDAHVTMDAEFRILTVNAAGERALGKTQHDLVGRTHWEALPTWVGSEVERQFRRVLAERGEVHFTHHDVRDGHDRFLEIDAYPTEEGGIAIFWRDVTDRLAAEGFQREMVGHIAAYNAQLSRNAEDREQTQAALESRVAERTAALARANEALVAEIAERGRAEADRTALRRQLALAEEDERRRLARELHDQLGQHLTAMTLGLEAASAVVAADSPVRARLVALRELAAVLTRDARSLAVSLRPPELDDVGLGSAVASYVDQWAARYGVATELAVTGVSERAVPDAAANAVYRVLQEALTNVVKHAAARQVSVILDQPDAEVRLIVEDDGQGFDVEATTRLSAAEHRLGLAGMRERAALAGGTLTVESARDGGTTVYLRLPIGRPPDEARPAASTDRMLAL